MSNLGLKYIGSTGGVAQGGALAWQAECPGFNPQHVQIN